MKFNNNANDFDLINAIFLAKLSSIAYSDFKSSDFNNQLSELGLDYSKCKTFDRDGSEAFIIFDDEKIILSFRGTEAKSVEDWLTDAKVRKTAGVYDSRVHRGFYNALNDVWRDMEDEVENLLNENNRRVWVTGHSLGAALATLAAARLNALNDNIQIGGLYTFGQPRTGEKKFANRFNSNLKNVSFRVVNNNDMVTRVPPSALGYAHIGQLKYLDHKGKLHSDDTLSWWGRLYDRIEGRLDVKFGDGIKDHSMSDYLTLLEKNLTNQISN